VMSSSSIHFPANDIISSFFMVCVCVDTIF
jgi:hypothetical protein